MIKKEELHKLIQVSLSNESFEKIINTEEFYFQKLLDLYQEYKTFDTGSFENKLQDFIENPPIKFNFQSLLDEATNPLYYDFLLIIGKMVAVFDEKGYNTALWNPYEDRRRVSRAGFRQNKWTFAFIKYKLNDFNFDGLNEKLFDTFKNAINFIESPSTHLTITSNNHRRFVAEYFLNKSADYQDIDIIDFFNEYTTSIVNPLNKGVLVTNILYQPSIKKLWQIGVIGLIAADCTDWFDGYINESKNNAACILWNSAKPVGGSETLKYLRDCVDSGDGFYMYYSCKNLVNHRAKITDFAINQEELTSKNWSSSTDNIYGYSQDFSNYTDANKGAKIIFLAESLEKINALPIDEFKIYKEYERPRQHNLAPLQFEPDSVIKSNEQNDYQDGKPNPSNPRIPLNQILYGPPGTGKTYHTINKALEILNVDITGKSRSEIKVVYDQKIKDGQIVFTTFHQSMSYEDFIEGIKPDTLDNNVVYTVTPGVFMNISDAAKTPNQVSFNAAYDKLIKALIETEIIELKTPTGKKFGVSINSNNNLTLHTGKEGFKKQGTLTKENIQKQLNGEIKFLGWEGYFTGVINYLKAKYNYAENSENKRPNYVLIIDEINRGNVSQIFGELITLIEEDKRQGKIEALSVTLPYSKQPFSVPNNLYLIGTMNTADRSVEALDTALRRRFSFVEMSSKPELLSPEQMIWQLWWDYETSHWKEEPWFTKEQELCALLGAEDLSKMPVDEKEKLCYQLEIEKKDSSIFKGLKYTGLNLKELLETINRRIEKLISSDHVIGHSYFMPVCSLGDLLEVMYNKIIPLLQEYFYGDFGKIGLVLGKGFIRLKGSVNEEHLFAKFEYNIDDLKERDVYEILDYRKKATFEIELEKTQIKIDFKQAITLLITNQLESTK